MSEPADRAALEALAALDQEALREYVVGSRWFGSKSQEVAAASILEALVVRAEPPVLVLALAEVRFHPGTHDVYQLPLGLRPEDDGWEESVVGRSAGWTVYDALSDPELARELAEHVRAGAYLGTEEAAVSFRPLEGAEAVPVTGDVRPMGVEQSNSSVVFGERLVLKVYRRLEAGVNPELELLRFLTRHDFLHIASLQGWYEHAGPPLDVTLGTLQRFVPGDTDGWALALESLDRHDAAFFDRLRRLGEVTGRLHATLASDSADPAFAPEEPSAETIGILAATIDEETGAVFATLPSVPGLELIAARGEEVRARLREAADVSSLGRVIRHHGDYHLGQALWSLGDWVILDFEGEPARPLPERRRKRSPLRDVAGMLRSFAYAASVSTFGGTDEASANAWEARARDEFLAGYLPVAEPARILPSGRESLEKLLTLFELEKAVYELRYELDHRPEWVRVPVAVILRLLDEPLGVNA